MKIKAKNATMQKSVPMTEAMDSGTVENATIPSIEYSKSEKKLHLVSPATRLTLT